MNSPKDAFLSQYFAELPEVAYTRSGIAFMPRDTFWKFRDGATSINCNFDLIPTLAHPLIHGLKVALIWRFENKSPATASCDFNRTLRFLRAIATLKSVDEKGVKNPQLINQICSQDILNYRSSSKVNESRLAGLTGFLRKWHALGVAGIDDEVIKILDKIILKKIPQDVAVKTLNPVSGPFSDHEFDAIQEALNAGFKAGVIDEADFLLVWLFIAVGGRPTSMASLKLCDLLVPKDLTDGSDYGLKLPMAKQQDALARDQFIPLILSRQIAEPLHLWVKFLHQKYAALLPDPWQAPLFPSQKETAENDPKGFEYHCTSSALTQRVIGLFKRLRVHSERLNAPMHITPVRFRRTYGTRLAEEGCSALEIARLMGHKDTRSCDVYVELTSRMIDRIDKATAFAMAPLAQAFSGRIIMTEADATRPTAASRIVDFRIDQSGTAMGSCGEHTHCAFSKPLGCYGCSSFEPWLDGPHEAAFDWMLQKREELMKTTDVRIASINDRAILGCAQIIIRIRDIKGRTP
jgi:integrase